MKQGPLASLSIEELKSKEKSLKLAAGMLGGMMVVMLGAAIYMFKEKGFSVFTVMPLAFVPLEARFVTKIKKVRDEIQSRNAG